MLYLSYFVKPEASIRFQFNFRPESMEPTILSRDEHPVSRKDISSAALKVLYRLKECGYEGYLAGGCVRDLLLGGHPKDFDVATNATPEEVKRCFRNCRLIGRRFRLAHVCFGPEIIEVATFRANATEGPVEAEKESDDSDTERESGHQTDSVVDENNGIVLRDNVYGTPEEDAFRRDFTVNALFYDIKDFSIIDYVGALKDIEERKIRCIGEPSVRYQEDPVRMLRAIRFAATLNLDIEEEAYEEIKKQAEHMGLASNARLFEELIKVFNSGAAAKAFELLQDCGLLAVMLPRFAEWLKTEADEAGQAWVQAALQQMDKWKKANVKASSELLYGLLFTPLIRSLAASWPEEDASPNQKLKEALFSFQRELAERVLIPKRITFQILDLLATQDRFLDRSPAKVARFTKRPFFREALVLFKFDNMVNSNGHADLIHEWTEDLRDLPPPPKQSRHRGRGGRRPRHHRRRR